MRVTIHQPEHMPWPGFFHKMINADLFIILDTVQYRKNYFQNRNRIVGEVGDPIWLTVPTKNISFEELISEKLIDKTSNHWPRKYLNLIKSCYTGTQFFKDYSDELFQIVSNDFDKLADLNIALIMFFRKHLGIGCEIMLSSTITHYGSKSDLNLALCKAVGANEYLSGASGRDYLDLTSFSISGIKVLFNDYNPPNYLSPNYHPYLSTLDLLFRHGPNAVNIIKTGGKEF